MKFPDRGMDELLNEAEQIVVCTEAIGTQFPDIGHEPFNLDSVEMTAAWQDRRTGGSGDDRK